MLTFLKKLTAVAALTALTAMQACASLPFKDWLGDGKVVQTKDGKACLELTPESREHRVAACELSGEFFVYAPGKSYVYKQKDLSATFRERLIAYMRSTGYAPAGLKGATVELWLVAPVLAPDAAHFVAAVLAPGGNFSVELPLELANWRVETNHVTLLGRERFPSREARQAGVIFVEAQSYVRPVEFAGYLEKRGYSSPSREDGGIVAIHTQPFAERAAADRLLGTREGRLFIAGIDVPHARGIDAAMARALTFPLLGN